MRIKRWVRQYAYILAGLKDLFGYRPSLIDIEIDDSRFIDSGTFVIISNTHYYGGTYQITPYAEIDDGFLDVCVYKGSTQMGLIHFGLNMLSKRHLNMDSVRYYRARRVKLSSKSNIHVQVDGDALGTLPMSSHIVPGALRVYC
jgi:diacylglycerol kinase (ATP)